MASVRLSSSRNCENSGANLRVSAWAFRRFHHFWIMTVSDQMDMPSITNTMPLANQPMCPYSSIRSTFISQNSSRVGELLVQLEREWELHELLHFPATDLGGVELHRGKHRPDRRREQVVRRLEDLEGLHVGLSFRVDDKLGEHFALDVALAEHIGIARARIAGNRKRRLLDLELEVGLVRIYGTRPAFDALAGAALDTLSREVVLVRHGLGEVDVRDLVRDLDRRGEHLESLGWRRSRDDVRWRRRLLLGRRRFVLGDFDELHLFRLFLRQLLAGIRRRVDQEAAEDRVQDDAEDGSAGALLLLGLRLDQLVEHANLARSVGERGSTQLPCGCNATERRLQQEHCEH